MIPRLLLKTILPKDILPTQYLTAAAMTLTMVDLLKGKARTIDLIIKVACFVNVLKEKAADLNYM
jgi:hypothetical protein